jgi:hypothetical protein
MAGEARQGQAWHGRAGRGLAWRGWARLGEARHGRRGESRRGKEWHGGARQARNIKLTLTKGFKMKIQEVTWKRGIATKGIDPVKAHNALQQIGKQNGGITDDGIVAAASRKNHTLHNWFEWDDSAAAIEHRRRQARDLISSIHVVYQEAPATKTRMYQVDQRTPTGSEARTVYSTTEEVLSNPESRDRLIAEAIRMAMEFRRRFKMLYELDNVMAAIDSAIAKLADD